MSVRDGFINPPFPPRLLMLQAIAFLLLTVTAAAQTADVTGQITDSNGAAVPGAEVTITNIANGTERKAVSNDDGFYSVQQLLPAVYRIGVQRQGFNTAVQENVTLAVEQTARLDFTLPTGDVSATIQVTSDAPVLSQETSSLGTVIDNKKVQSIPLNGRSPFRLVQLTPGVISSVSASGQFRDVPVNTTFESNFSINGGRNQSNEVLIDGVPATSGFFNQVTTIPSVEATQEFKVESNSASAEFGRFGGGVVNVSTKAGGNSFDGTLYEFVRNDAFDANDFFNNRAGREKPPFRMNQFGCAVSGPIFSPRFGEGGPAYYSGRGKTFFFTDYQGTRWRRGDVYTNRVPTAAERNGDFSASLGAVIPGVTNPDGSPARVGQIYDPATTRTVGGQIVRNPFPGNIIPLNRLSPLARALLTYYPPPNATLPGGLNFVSNAVRGIDGDQFSGRIDHNFTEAYRTFGRYSFTKTDLSQPDYFGNVATPDQGSVGTTRFRYHTFALDNTVSLNASTLLNVRLGFARWFQIRDTRSFGFDITGVGFSGALASQLQVPVFPVTNIETYSSLGGQSFFKNGNDTYSLIPSITRTSGRQTRKFGADLRLRRINFFDVFAGSGQYAFNRNFTRGPVFNTARTDVGNGFASFLLGAPVSGSAPNNSAASLENYYVAGFVQNDIKVTPKLTINLGLRYEIESPYTERYHRLVSFDRDATSPIAAQARAAYAAAYAANPAAFVLTPDQFQPRGALRYASAADPRVYDFDNNNFAPRVGFAYSIFDKTVVRGGFGISYSPLETTNNGVGSIPNAGFSATTPIIQTSLNGGQTINPAFNFSNPFPAVLNPPTGSSLGDFSFLGQGFEVFDAEPETPYTMQWNLNLQRELPYNILFDVAYAGSRNVHLTRPNQLNALDPAFFNRGTLLTNQVANPFRNLVGGNLGTTATVQQSQLLLAHPQYTGILVLNDTSGNSSYHSLQIKLDKRLSGGVNFLVAYTFSKLISDTTNQLAPLGDFTNFTGVQNFFDFQSERALSEFDTPHILAATSVVELPFGRGRRFLANANGFVGRLLEGFQVNAVFRYESGVPLQFSAAAPQLGGNRPRLTGQPIAFDGDRPTGERVAQWFNTDAFATLQNFQLGDTPRTVSARRAPSYRNVDVSLIKNLRLSEGTNLQLRAEVFNAFNTPQFALPNTNRNSPLFGQITATRALPRVIQFAVKFNF